MNAIDHDKLSRWLATYGRAWETRDADLVATLFTGDASYQETPFAEPFHGRDGVLAYWSRVTADQSDIAFLFEVIAMVGMTGIAQWSAKFRSISGEVPVELNGVFVLEFANAGEVRSLREWWHVR
jgi:nuclear transport factor 2 (NTF2) superfamily protein